MFSAFNPSKCTHLEQWAADCAAPGEHNLGLPRVSSPTLYPLGHVCVSVCVRACVCVCACACVCVRMRGTCGIVFVVLYEFRNAAEDVFLCQVKLFW